MEREKEDMVKMQRMIGTNAVMFVCEKSLHAGSKNDFCVVEATFLLTIEKARYSFVKGAACEWFDIYRRIKRDAETSALLGTKRTVCWRDVSKTDQI